MVFPTSLLAITCLIKGVDRFAGPLWAAKFQFVGIRYQFLNFLPPVMTLFGWYYSETPYMVLPTSLLAVTGLIRGVELFAGPLWAAKFQ